MQQSPDLVVAARPTEARTQSRAAGSQLSQVAASLTAFNPQLERISSRRIQEGEDEQFRLGVQSALEDAARFGEEVKDGSRDLSDNPIFQKGRREQIGRNTGHAIRAELSEAYQLWEGKDAEDADVNGFISDFIAERTANIDDADVLAGLQPQLNQVVNNTLESHINYTRNRTKAEAVENTSIEIGNILDEITPPGGGLIDPVAFGERIEVVRNIAILSGQTPAEIDAIVTDAIFAKAEGALDENLLDALDAPRIDPRTGNPIPPISSKPDVQKRILDARVSISRDRYQLERNEDTAENEAEDEARDVLQEAFIEAAASGETSIPQELRIQAFRALGSEAGNRFVNSHQALFTSEKTGERDYASADDERKVAFAVARGQVSLVEDYVNDGTIPSGLALQALRGVRSARNSAASSGRAADSALQKRARAAAASEEERVEALEARANVARARRSQGKATAEDNEILAAEAAGTLYAPLAATPEDAPASAPAPIEAAPADTAAPPPVSDTELEQWKQRVVQAVARLEATGMDRNAAARKVAEGIRVENPTLFNQLFSPN